MTQPTWQDLPKEIQEEMLNEQERQGNKRDAGVFEKEIDAAKFNGGFDWHKHKSLTPDNWEQIVMKLNFAPFYEKFPKKEPDTIAWDEPVEMLAWDDDESHSYEETIYGKFKGAFVCGTSDGSFNTYKNAKPIIPTINWDEFKEGDVVELETAHNPKKWVFYISEIVNGLIIFSSQKDKLGTLVSFQKSNIKSIRKLK